MKMKCLLIIFVCGILLTGCFLKNAVMEDIPEINMAEENIKEKEVISFSDKKIEIPSDMAIFHTSHDFKTITTDSDTLYLTLKGDIEDLCILRCGKISSTVNTAEKADEIIKSFNKPELYNATDIFFGETLLDEVFYYQNALTTALDDTQYAIVSMIPKYGSDVYTVIFKADDMSIPICNDADVKIILNSFQNCMGYTTNEDFLYKMLNTFIKTRTKDIANPRGFINVPSLKDETSYTILPNQEYFLDLTTGIYDIELVEGKGDLYVEDARYDVRSCMMGYASDNSYDLLKDVTLVHGGKIYTTLGLTIKIIK